MDDEDFEYRISDIESNVDDLDYRIEQNEWNLYELETKNIEKEQYEIFFSPTTIKKYIIDLKKYQETKRKFFPTSEKEFKKYFDRFEKFKCMCKDFSSEMIKYSDLDDFDILSNIIANQGRSGFNFLQTVDKIIELNKPVLLFYGFEHLSAFFFNMHFNFTHCNQWEKSIKKSKSRVIRNHGLGPNEFEDIKISNSGNIIEILLSKKISLKKIGLSSRFFSIFNPELLEFFNNQEKISLQDLLMNFFVLQRSSDRTGNDYISIPKKIKDKFKDHFDSSTAEISLGSATLTIYLISFLFAYLSRYRMYLWKELLTNNEKNVNFFVKFILKYSKDYFIRFLFHRLKDYEERNDDLIPYKFTPLTI